jgi:hypothetical protein
MDGEHVLAREPARMAETEAEPQLQAPGAGLPRTELFISRIGFRLGTPFLSRGRAGRWFRADADRMLATARSLDPARAAKRVLIPRLRGWRTAAGTGPCT